MATNVLLNVLIATSPSLSLDSALPVWVYVNSATVMSIVLLAKTRTFTFLALLTQLESAYQHALLLTTRTHPILRV